MYCITTKTNLILQQALNYNESTLIGKEAVRLSSQNSFSTPLFMNLIKSAGQLPPTSINSNSLLICISPDGKWAAVYQDNIIKIIDVCFGNSGAEVHTLADVEDVTSLSWSCNGKFLATAAGDTIIIWNTITGVEESSNKQKDKIQYCKWSPNGKYLLLVFNANSFIVWDVSGTSNSAFITFEDLENPIAYCDWAPNSNYIVSVGKAILKIWKTEDGLEVKVFKLDSECSFCNWSPDGQSIVVTTQKHLTLFEIWGDEHSKNDNIIIINNLVKHCTWSSDSKWLYCLCVDKTLKILDKETGSIQSVFTNIVNYCISGTHLVTINTSLKYCIYSIIKNQPMKYCWLNTK